MVRPRYWIRRNRSAFTLIELLVVMSIIAVLLGILLPAINKVREAGNRTNCLSNLHQLGMAILAYHQEHQVFPPAWDHFPAGSPNRHAWGAYILPYTDESPLAKRYDWSVTWSHLNNQPVVTARLKLFMCPSAPGKDGISPVPAGPSDYFPTMRVGHEVVANGFIPAPPPGMILERLVGVMAAPGSWPPSHPQCSMDDIKDGPSHTILLGEDAGRPDRYQVGSVAAGTVDGTGWADDQNGNFLTGSPPNGVDPARKGGPCAINCTNANEMYAFHFSGANVVFADGRARTLSKNTPIAVVAAMITRANQDPIPSEDY